MIDKTNYVGMRFGRLTVLELDHIGNDYRKYYKCICDCKKEKIVNIRSLKNGYTKSCGCLLKEFNTDGNHNKKHGMSGTRFYKIWKGIKNRCLNPNPNYEYFKNYIGRGISVCNEWLEFINFKINMYDSYLEHVSIYGEKQTTIDRIDNNLGYSKDNCKWSTIKEQNSNRRKETKPRKRNKLREV